MSVHVTADVDATRLIDIAHHCAEQGVLLMADASQMDGSLVSSLADGSTPFLVRYATAPLAAAIEMLALAEPPALRDRPAVGEFSDIKRKTPVQEAVKATIPI